MLKSSAFYRLAAAGPILLSAALLAGCGSGAGLPGDPGAPVNQNALTSTGASSGTHPTSPAGSTFTSTGSSQTPPSGLTHPGGTTSSAPTTGKRSFDPNFIADLQNGTASWAHLPVKVYFIHDANYTAERQKAAQAGFDEWVTDTRKVLSYQLVSSQAAANLTINFDPTRSDSVTTCMIGGKTIVSATMRLGTAMPAPARGSLPMADLQVIAAHELGHAFGIEGHSKNPADVMYWVHMVGHANFLTQRDLNTVQTIYYSLFTPGRAASGPVDSEPIGPIHAITME